MNFSSLFFALLIFNLSLHAMDNLITAVNTNDTKAAIALLKNGVNPNVRQKPYGNFYGEELVTTAANNNNEELLQALFNAGAPVYGLYGEPVHTAAFRGNTQLVEFLLVRGATTKSAEEGLILAIRHYKLTLEQTTQVRAVIEKYIYLKA